jgi:hypothetical protein
VAVEFLSIGRIESALCHVKARACSLDSDALGQRIAFVVKIAFLILNIGKHLTCDRDRYLRTIRSTQLLTILTREFVLLRRAVAIDLGRVTEKLDASFNRTHIALADRGLQVHEHVLAARVVDLSQLLDSEHRLARQRLAAGFVTCLA